MSHTTKMSSVEIRSEASLRAAVADLQAKGTNLELVQDAAPRMYFANQHGRCPLCLKLKDGKYDVGFEREADGRLVPVFDDWNNYVGDILGVKSAGKAKTEEEKISSQLGKLMQRYARHEMVGAVNAQGYIIESETEDAVGNVHLRVNVG